MGILSRLFGFAIDRAVEEMEYQQSPLGRASQKMKNMEREIEKALSVESDVQEQIVPVIKKMK